MLTRRVREPASSHIWALVSGFPKERRWRRQLLVFQAYIDGSGTGAYDVFVLAGYIAPAEEWAKFSDEWQELLDSPSLRLPYFKMSEMRHSPERRERCGWFYRVIEGHVSAAVSCVIDVAGLVKAVREFQWPPNFVNLKRLENPYFVAFKAIMNVLAQHQVKLGIDQPIDFIFDEESEKKTVLEGWERIKLFSTPDVRALMGDMPIYRDDKSVLPLQAADLFAWWIRHWRLEGVGGGVENLRFWWEPKVDIPRLDMSFSEEDFLAEFRKAYDPAIQARSLLSDEEISRILRAVEERSS